MRGEREFRVFPDTTFSPETMARSLRSGANCLNGVTTVGRFTLPPPVVPGLTPPVLNFRPPLHLERR